MRPADRERVKDLLSRAARLPPEDRAAFIRRASGIDHETAEEAIDLLATLDDPRFLSAPTGVGMAAAIPGAAVPGEGPGTVIDRYKLLQLIGEGGFGSVFLAEQTHPVHRKVALKIIKAGMDTRQVIARFEAERQALALMEHPGIARVLDAGSTNSGRPYFVMELVRGEPLTRYCDHQRLTVARRLALFQEVCYAVQHAHQKGIIHRDLKPSNIMVTVADGEPVPKVIDFGIAKATELRLTDKTLFTEIHQLIGTPEYMSPEQAEVSGVDVDTRSDIYALGVLLYELLTGTTPIDRNRLRTTPLADIQRIIRDEEAQRPSLRLATLGSSARGQLPLPEAGLRDPSASSVMEVAQRRQTDPLQLTRTLRGDLDWIILKCLAKDRRRRYPTAIALAEDIGRYLSNQPVQATPPSRWYALQKFALRNRVAVAAGAAITVVLLLGAVVSIQFGIREAGHRLAAESARIRAETAEEQARVRAGELEQVARFQEAQLSGVDGRTMGLKLRTRLLKDAQAQVERAKGAPDEVTIRIQELEAQFAGTDFTTVALGWLEEIFFQPALEAIDKEFADQPLVQARLLTSTANTLHSLGLFDAARRPLEAALVIRRRELGDRHSDTLRSTSDMGYLLLSQGKLDDAEPYLRGALEAELEILGPHDPNTLTSMCNFALLLQEQGRLTEAGQYHREALEGRRAVLGDEHTDTLGSINNMGFFLQAQGKLDEAEPYLREAVEKLRQIRGPEHPDTLVSINNLGALLYVQGKFSEAEPFFREAVEVSRRVLGGEHHDTLRAIDNLSVVLRAQGRLTESESYCRESMESHRHALGNEHPDTLISIGNMGLLLAFLGRLSEAESYLHEALEGSKRVHGDDHPDTLRARFKLAAFLSIAGAYAESERNAREVLERRRRVLGDRHPDSLLSLSQVCDVLLAQSQVNEAEPYCNEALEALRETLGETHPSTLTAVKHMGTLYLLQGMPAEAIALLSGSDLAARKAFTHGNAAQLGSFLTVVGHAQCGVGEFLRSEANLNEAYTILEESTFSTYRDQFDVLSALTGLYEQWQLVEPMTMRSEEAAQWRQRLEQLQRDSPQAPLGSPPIR